MSFREISPETQYEKKKRISEELPHEITQREIDEFTRICEKYEGTASITPFTPKKRPIDILAEQPSPRVAREYMARMAGLRYPPPAKIRTLIEFLQLTEEDQTRICEQTMYTLNEAETMKDVDDLLKAEYSKATLIEGLRGKEALEKAFLETCREKITHYFSITATPSLLVYGPLEIIPRTPGAQIISSIMCLAPKPPPPLGEIEERARKEARRGKKKEEIEITTELDRKQTIDMTSEICNMNIKAPYILEINEIFQTKTTITRYADPTFPGIPTVDEVRIETKTRAEPKVPDNKLEAVKAYLSRYRPHILREIEKRARRGENEKTMLKLTAIAVYIDNLKRVLEERIKEQCMTPVPPITYRYEKLKDTIKGYEHILPEKAILEELEQGRLLLKALERAVIKIPQVPRYELEPICPTTAEITTEEEIISPKLITAGWRIIEEIPREARIGTLTITITACATTCPQLKCLLQVTNPITIKAIVGSEAKKLGFIEF